MLFRSIFDLGLTREDRDLLSARFSWCRVEPFAFDAYPPHVRRLPLCAWKPIVVDEVMRAQGGLVLWLDSATVLTDVVDEIFSRIAHDGVLALAGQSPISRWCHTGTLRHMEVPDDIARKRCRSAGVVGFDGGRPFARALLAEWRRFALLAECIDPPGANRANHRYDQAILSNLLYAFERDYGLVLTGDEIDISSVAPVGWLTTRTRVAPWVPLKLDPLVRAYQTAYKRADRLLLRMRGSR